MVANCLDGDEEALADLGIGQTERQCVEDLLLASGQVERVFAPRPERPSRDAADAQLREPFPVGSMERRAIAGRRGESQDHGDIAGSLGVVHQPVS